MSDFDALLKAYDYDLPKDLIALTPAHPRDSARLLVYNRTTDTIEESTFVHLADFLPKGALLVFNETKVIPARIHATKATGGMVEVLATACDFAGNTCVALANKKLSVGDTLSTAHGALTVLSIEGSYRFSATPSLRAVIEGAGEIPIPPYLKDSPLTESERRAEYQTIFAKNEGSVAAPTASLHFTHELLTNLREAGIEEARVTLHVNLGTFAPLTETAVRDGLLHEETYVISEAAAEAINRAKRDGRPIIPVGTTALRTIESAADENGMVHEGIASTRLFIREGYVFKVATGMITNFHVPQSSLLMLVAALIGHEQLFDLYKYAKKHQFRFLSFGDGMLLL